MNCNAISLGKTSLEMSKIPHFSRKYHKISLRCQKGKNYFQVCLHWTKMQTTNENINSGINYTILNSVIKEAITTVIRDKII